MAGAGGQEVGRVSIRVVPDVDKFRPKVEAELKKLRNVKIKIYGDTEQLEQDIDKATKDKKAKVKVEAEADADFSSLKPKAMAAAKAASSTVRFRSSLDSSGVLKDAFLTSKGIQNLLSQKPWKFSSDSLSFRTALKDTGLLNVNLNKVKAGLRDIIHAQRVISQSKKGLVYDDVAASANRYRRAISQLKNTASGGVGATKQIFQDLKDIRGLRGAITSIDGYRLSLFALGRAARQTAPALKKVVSTGREFASIRFSGLKDIAKEFTGVATPMKSAANSIRGFISHASVLGRVAVGVGLSAVGIQGAVVGVSAVVGYLVDGLKQLSGAAAFLPGLAGGAALVGATLYAGFKGMGSALSSAVDESADLEAAIKNLAPEAQDFARSVREITPAWKDVAKAVQGNMFKGMGDSLREVSEKQLPGVSAGMQKLGTSVNGVMQSFMGFAGHERTVAALKKGFESTSTIVDNFAGALQPLLLGLQDMGVIGLQSIADLSGSWEKWATDFSEWTGSNEGQETIKKWIDDSVQGFKDLGATIGNVYATAKEIGNAFGINFEGNAIEKFRELTQSFQDWIGTADDANSRISIFADKIQSISAPWIETLKTAWNELAPAFKELSPLIEDVSTKLADNIGGAIEFVAPKLEKLFKFLSDHKGVFGSLAAGLLTLQTGLLVFKGARMLMAPYIGAIGAVTGGIGKASTAVGKFRDKHRGAAADVANSKGGSGGFYADVGKSSDKAADKVGKNASKINKAGKFGRITSALSNLGSKFTSLGKAAGKAGGKDGLMKGLMKGMGKINVGGLLKGFGGFAQKLLPIGLKAAGFLAKGLLRFIPIVGWALMAWDIVSLITNNWGKIKEWIGKLGDWFKEQWPKIKEGAANIWDSVVEKWNSAWAAIGSWLSGIWTGIVEWAKNTWNSFVEWLGSIWQKVVDGWNGFWSGIGSWLAGIWNGIIEWARGLWEGFTEWIGNIWTKVSESWSAFWSFIGNLLSSLWNWVVSLAMSVWTSFVEWISNIWTTVTETWSAFWSFIGNLLSSLWNWIVSLALSVWQSVVMFFSTLWTNIQAIWTTVWTTIVAVITGLWNGFLATASFVWNLLKTIVISAWNGLLGMASAIWGGIVSLISGLWNSLVGIASSVWNGISSTISGVWNTIVSVVSSCASTVWNTITTAFNNVVSTVTSAMSSFLTSVQNGFNNAISEASALPGKFISALGNLGSMLISSGKALIQGFIDGILSMGSAVADAAGSIVQKARDFFPFSPAKKGPFSGKGYTTHSGKALTKDFASGMLSNKKLVSSSAAEVAKSAQEQFNSFAANPHGSMVAYRKQKILNETMKKNAQTIAEFREKHKDEEAKLSKEIADIEKSKLSDEEKSKKIADAKAKSSKKYLEDRKKMEESLETPDYSDIDMSLRSLYIDGFKEMFTDALLNGVKQADFVGKTRGIVMQAVKAGRGVFGNNPLFSKLEESVNAKHFEEAITKVIEDSKIAEVPVELVVSNLDQFKSDIGMGDGVVSRAIDQALDYNVNNSDAKQFKDSEGSKTEIHYHVEDMNEAIRLEKQRERKAAMKRK